MSKSLARFTFWFAGLLVVAASCGSSTANDPPPTTGTGTGTGTGTSTTTTTAKLVINELQPANKDTVTDENGDADDWIEIYNPEDKAVDLNGYSVSDSANKQVINGPLTVPAGGYVLLWADDSPSQGSAHLGFKLSAKKGDTVTLADASGKTLDAVTFGAATDQNVFARFPNGTGAFAWCTQATPGTANGSVCSAP